MFQSLLTIYIAVTYCISASALPANDPTQEQKSKTDETISLGIRSFAVDLLKVLQQNATPEENVLVSPVNIYQALALVHLGAAGTTRNELADIMGLPKDDKRVTEMHESLGQISKKIQQKPDGKTLYFATSDTTMANGIFVQKEYSVKKDYLQLVKNYHDGNVSNLDFAKHAKEATNTINKWASEKTNGRIPQIFSNPLNPATVIVLVSSLYFSAKWEAPFWVGSTKLEKFSTGIKNIDTQMMQNEQTIPYISDPALQIEAISIPYWGRDYSMVIVLPRPSQTLANLINVLDAKKLGEIVKNAKTEKVDYKIPRIKYSWRKSLVQPLYNRGLKAVFNSPDFSNMLSANFAISEIIHAAEIEVDEEGTKASAITAVQGVGASGHFEPPKKPIPFYVNRPFLLNIYYHPKDIILFSGLVYKPDTV